MSPYATVATVSTTYTWFGDTASGSTLGLVPGALPNRSLTWATVEKYNIGIDFGTMNGRLNGNIDLYTGKTTDMLMNRSVPYPTGFQSAKDNVGKVTNKGIEISLNSVNIDGDGKDKFRWTSDLVFDLNRNKVKSLYGKDYEGKEIVLGVRPENIVRNGPVKLAVTNNENLGMNTLVHGKIGGTKIVVCKFAEWCNYEEGDEINIGFDPGMMHFFEKPEGDLPGKAIR